MSKCDLSIELDQTQPFHWSGEAVRGTVCLQAHQELNCRAVTLHSAWQTRGKGNVNSGASSKQTLHVGVVAAGETLRLPFEIHTLPWPPTYHGYQFSVEHMLVASVDIPWAFDPKTSVPIHVLPRPRATIDLPKVAAPGTVGKLFGWGIAFVILTVIASVFGSLAGLPAVVPVLAVAALLFTIWLLFTWLPSWMLGEVTAELETLHPQAGDDLVGWITITPHRPLNPQGIYLTLTAEEVCVSGSGSNRKTYNHKLYEANETIVSEPTLRAGETARFDFSIPLPKLAAYSLDESSNKLRWQAGLRIGLAGIPDWRKTFALVVVPPHDPNRLMELRPAHLLDGRSGDDQAFVPLSPPDLPHPHSPHLSTAMGMDISLGETVDHLWILRGQPAQLSTVTAALVGLPLAIEVQIDRRWLSAGAEASWLRPGETLFWGSYPEPPLPISLAVPSVLADEVAAAESTIWQGHGEIVGWDSDAGRLRIRVSD